MTVLGSLSVVLPNYNHAHWLPGALDAMLAQSVQALEIIVVDDASTDNSWAVLQDYATRHACIIAHRHAVNGGTAQAMSTGLSLARGDYVYFAAADDRVLSGLFSDTLTILAANPQAALSSAKVRLISEAGDDRGEFPTPIPARVATYIDSAKARRLLFKLDSWIMGNTAIYRRDLLLRHGGFSPELGSFCDGYVSRLLTAEHGACFIPKSLCAWRKIDSGLSSVTMRDVEKSLTVLSRAMERMAGQERYFPPAYRRRFAARWRFGSIRAMLGSAPRTPTPTILAVLGGGDAIDRLVLAALGGLPVGRSKAMIGYLMLRLRHFDLVQVLFARIAAAWQTYRRAPIAR